MRTPGSGWSAKSDRLEIRGGNWDSALIAARPESENTIDRQNSICQTAWMPGRHSFQPEIHKGHRDIRFLLDNKEVKEITEHLDDSAESGEPSPLSSNADHSFIGSFILGAGFVLRPEEAREFVRAQPDSAEVLFPYLGGSDLNGNPDQSASRVVINFGEKTLDQAAAYHGAFQRIESLVLPIRRKDNRKSYRDYWWQHAEKRPKLYRSISGLRRVLVRTQASKHHAFAFVGNGQTFDQKLVVFPTDDMTDFSILSSSLHEIWLWKFKSDLGDTPNYSPSRVFQTFPLHVWRLVESAEPS